jgi:hypothetical protein
MYPILITPEGEIVTQGTHKAPSPEAGKAEPTAMDILVECAEREAAKASTNKK